MTSNLEPRTVDRERSELQLAIDWTLDADEARVLRHLKARRGRAQAIRVPDLAQLVELDERELQKVVKRLREQHGQPILSSAGKPPGLWFAATPDELEACIREQRRKAVSTMLALRALRRHLARLRGQGTLPSAA